MRTVALGRTDVELPAIGLGTWGFERDPEGSSAAVRRALDLGLTHVDTAEMYGEGEVERILGRALAGRRDEAFLVSKVLPHHASREGTLAACRASLRRLGTERLDLYLLHWRGPHPLEETFAAFEELRRAGDVRAWGVSNFDVEDLEEALTVLGPEAGHPERLVCNQVLYHLQERAIEHRVLPFCEPRGITVVGYSPFGSGSFPPPSSRGGRVLASIAAELGATPRQTALAFLARRKTVALIPKSSRVEHVEELAGAGGLVLELEDEARIDAAFPRGNPRPGLPMI